MEDAHILTLYKTLVERSDVLLNACQVHQWDVMPALFADIERMDAQIRACGDGHLKKLTVEEQYRARALIERFVVNEVQTKQLVQPRMAVLATVVNSLNQEMRISEIYGKPSAE